MYRFAGVVFLGMLGISLLLQGFVWEKKTVKIGALYSMEGRASQYGVDSLAAAQMAIDDVNSQGGAAGYKLELISEDDRSKADYAAQVAERFVTQEHVDFLFGVISSAVGISVSKVSKQYKKIFIGTDHASTLLTSDDFQPYYFRTSNNSFQSMAAAALYLKDIQKGHPWKKISYIGPDYAYGYSQYNELRYNLDRFKVDYKVSGVYWPKLYAPNYNLFVNNLLSDNPDVLVIGFWGGDTVAFLRAANLLGLLKNRIVILPDAGGNYETMSMAGDSLPLGLIMSARHHNNWPDTPRNHDYVQKFYQKNNRYPTYAAEGAYAGIMLIAKAIQKVGNPQDTEAILKAMEGMKLALPEDPVGFTSYIDPKTHQIVQMQAIGETVENKSFPPATRMLGNFRIYKAEDVIPPAGYKEKDYVKSMD